MSYEQEHKDFTNRLLTGMPGTRVAWENAPAAEPARPYIRPYIINAQPEEFTMRNDSVEYPGVFSADVVATEGEGVHECNALADQIAALFLDVTFGTSDSIRTGHPYKTRLGVESGRYIINVSIPFVRVVYS